MRTGLISADGHAVEPVDLWIERLPSELRDRAPRVFLEDDGKVLVVDNKRRDVPLLNVDIPENFPWALDPVERAERLAAEGIAQEVLYPQWTMILYGIEDPDLQSAVLWAYNEWLAEFCKAAPGHFIGIGLLPVHDVDAAVDEIAHIESLGLRGVNVPSKREGLRYNSRSFEPLWSAIAAAGLPLSLHAAPTIEHKGLGAVPANITMNLSPFRNIWPVFVFSGILDRHPALRVVLTEGGIGWLPSALHDMDMVFRDYAHVLDPELSETPSAIWRRQCYATFQEDPAGIRLLDMIGYENVMWGADVPHPEGTYGSTQETLERLFAGVPDDVVGAVCGGNASRVWAGATV